MYKHCIRWILRWAVFLCWHFSKIIYICKRVFKQRLLYCTWFWQYLLCKFVWNTQLVEWPPVKQYFVCSMHIFCAYNCLVKDQTIPLLCKGSLFSLESSKYRLTAQNEHIYNTLWDFCILYFVDFEVHNYQYKCKFCFTQAYVRF